MLIIYHDSLKCVFIILFRWIHSVDLDIVSVLPSEHGYRPLHFKREQFRLLQQRLGVIDDIVKIYSNHGLLVKIACQFTACTVKLSQPQMRIYIQWSSARMQFMLDELKTVLVVDMKPSSGLSVVCYDNKIVFVDMESLDIPIRRQVVLI